LPSSSLGPTVPSTAKSARGDDLVVRLVRRRPVADHEHHAGLAGHLLGPPQLVVGPYANLLADVNYQGAVVARFEVERSSGLGGGDAALAADEQPPQRQRRVYPGLPGRLRHRVTGWLNRMKHDRQRRGRLRWGARSPVRDQDPDDHHIPVGGPLGHTHGPRLGRGNELDLVQPRLQPELEPQATRMPGRAEVDRLGFTFVAQLPAIIHDVPGFELEARPAGGERHEQGLVVGPQPNGAAGHGGPKRLIAAGRTQQ